MHIYICVCVCVCVICISAKIVTCCLEQMLEATHHKVAIVRPTTSHHTNLRSKRNETLWLFKVSLGVMAMKSYSTLSLYTPQLEPHHQFQFSVILKTSLFGGGAFSSVWGYSPRILKPTGQSQSSIEMFYSFYLDFYKPSVFVN